MAGVQIIGGADVIRLLRTLPEKQIPFATALGVTRIGQEVKLAEENEIRRVFDRPTPYTQNSLYLRPATKARLNARVFLREFAAKGTPATKYLGPQIEGGQRNAKRAEKLLRSQGILGANQLLAPGSGAPLDKYGNISKGMIVKMLSQLGAQFDRSQNTAGRRREFFPIYRGRTLVGIFRRTARGVVPFMIAISPPNYSPRFDFTGVAERVIDRLALARMSEAIAYTLRTAR